MRMDLSSGTDSTFGIMSSHLDGRVALTDKYMNHIGIGSAECSERLKEVEFRCKSASEQPKSCIRDVGRNSTVTRVCLRNAVREAQ